MQEHELSITDKAIILAALSQVATS